MSIFGDIEADARVTEAEELLRRYIRSEVLAEVIDRPSLAAGGLTLRELAANDPQQLVEVVRNMFDLRRLDAGTDVDRDTGSQPA